MLNTFDELISSQTTYKFRQTSSKANIRTSFEVEKRQVWDLFSG